MWYEKIFIEVFDDCLLKWLKDMEFYLIFFNEEKWFLFFKICKVIEGGGKDLVIVIGGVFLVMVVMELM